MFLYDKKIILQTALLLKVCDQTIFDTNIFKDVIFIRFCNTRYHAIISLRQ